MPYSALCLDLDDTLWPVAPAIVSAEKLTAAFLAREFPEVVPFGQLPAVTIAQMRRWREEVAALHTGRAYDLTWLRTEALRCQAAAAGLSEAAATEMAAAAFEVFFAERHAVEPYAEVPEALERLAQRFPLYVLSNGNADPARTSLGQYFRAAYSARGLGMAKPDPRAFRAVAESAGIPVERWLYVGDDPYADVMGARSAGMATAWVHRHEKHWPESLERADHEFADLAGLVEWVDSVDLAGGG
jgi:FMN hydrolase / 5-amino-6-(5-phospho-D-ribitylamino)uracil phosphatase